MRCYPHVACGYVEKIMWILCGKFLISFYPQKTGIKPRFINILSTAETAQAERVDDFSTGFTHHKKKSDRIYSIDDNRTIQPRRTLL
jgi:hypothetical protein